MESLPLCLSLSTSSLSPYMQVYKKTISEKVNELLYFINKIIKLLKPLKFYWCWWILSELQMNNGFWIVNVIGSVNCHLDRIRIGWEMTLWAYLWGWSCLTALTKMAEPPHCDWHHPLVGNPELCKQRRKLSSSKYWLLSASWLWKWCKIRAPAALICPPRWTVLELRQTKSFLPLRNFC